MENTNRIEEIDIIKGIAIILMVYGHCYLPFTRFIYLFHMAVFVIASGVVYKTPTSSIDVINKCLKRIKGLYIPYVFFNFLYLFLTPYFNEIALLDSVNDYSTVWGGVIKTLLFHGYTEFGGPMWFLRALFFASVLFLIFDYLCNVIFKRRLFVNISHSFIAVILLLVSWRLVKNGESSVIKMDIFQLGDFYILYYGGVIISGVTKNIKKFVGNTKVGIAVLLISFVLLLILNNFGRIELLLGEIQNPLFFISASVLGFCLLYYIAFFICKYLSPLKELLLVIGKNTIWILALHFFVFKLVNLVIVSVMGLSEDLISVSPTLYGNTLYGLLYVSIGIIIPVILGILFKSLKKKMESTYENTKIHR